MHPPSFRRDRATILLYLLLSYYAYLQAIVAPAMNFIAAEQDLSDTTRGLHLSAFAIGMILVGLIGERTAARFGRPQTVWGGCLGMGIGAVVLAFGQTPFVTIPAAFIMGFLGSHTLIMTQALLSDRHAQHRAIPLTEANVVAVIFAAAAPLLVGASAGTLGWRAPLLIGAALLLIMWAVGRSWITDVPSPHKQEARATTRNALPMRFWLFWSVAFFGVSVEWSMIFWNAAYLERVGSLTTTDATSASTLFLTGMVVGRIIGSRLAHSAEPARLLVVSLGLAIFGFSIFWLAPITDLRLVGLALCGVGIANVWPLTLPTATSLVPQATDLANARMSLSASSATLIAPQILGSLADGVGIQNAVLLAGAMTLCALLAAIAGLAQQGKD
jgi:MFS family permease